MSGDSSADESPSDEIDGVPAWSFRHGRARALFLGRGAPGRDGGLTARFLPEGVRTAWLRQVHSARVVDAEAGSCGEGDALVVRGPGLAAAIATADCVPVVVAADGPGAAVVAVHAGWRGLVAGVLAAAVARLPDRANVAARIGPAIGACCYEVGEEVAEAVVRASSPAVRSTGPRGRPHLDLVAAAAAQLAAAGVSRISRVALCTRCRADRLWSHRREGEAAGRNLTLAWLDPEP